MTEIKKNQCACCSEGCDCGDCEKCSKGASACSAGACTKGSCTTWSCCGMSWWKWLLGILLLGFAFVAGSFHGMREYEEGRGWRGGERGSMMKMMGDKNGGMMGCGMMKGDMKGCGGMKDGKNCGMGGCGCGIQEGTITTGQVTGITGDVVSGGVATGN